ncbi:hypothetical protein LOTGIDRAFT_228466 [Lottia gigantea]|uniref:Kazal-like domain-containing protein n=1 Tax=Lottia gigantea TaxID=225164 RepID=V4AWR1_LOTGI|nr:hypothetical protein LOTGIDRAFT_228466 [Lottia gigantea]ESO97971.1 hypothetical protein LOTGIDRAFT_228466 [Lottia gigantea]
MALSADKCNDSSEGCYTFYLKIKKGNPRLYFSSGKETNRNGETMEEFIDLDEMFGYHVADKKEIPLGHDQLEIKITARPATPGPTSTTTAQTNDVITDTDDEDNEAISGAGSGSGMDEDESEAKNNETSLTFLDSEGVQLNSGEGKIHESEDFILTGTTLPSKATTRVSTKATDAAPTKKPEAVHDRQDNEEGAADGDIVNWVLPDFFQSCINPNHLSSEIVAVDMLSHLKHPRVNCFAPDTELNLFVNYNPSNVHNPLPEEGRDDDEDEDDDMADGEEMMKIDGGEQKLVTTTLPPTYKPEIPDIFVPPYLPVEATDPCQKTECYFGAVCKSRDLDHITCSCEFNCTKEDLIDICGTDGVLYPNDCFRRLASCQQQRTIDTAELKSCPDYSLKHPDLPTCQLVDAPRWGKWSQWIRHGDVDIRLRSCEVSGFVTTGHSACEGSRVEAKACKLKQIGKCRNDIGNETSQMKFACDGIDVKDTINADLTFGLVAHEDECLYSLYDLTRKKMVFTGWNISRVVNQGSLRRWCNKPELYIMSHTSLHSCKKSLKNLCKQSRKCKRGEDQGKKSLADYAHGCWRSFLVGNRIPAGLSEFESRFSFICQRFALDSSLGKVFGHKESYYGTIYDIKSRIPVVSVAAIKNLGDDMWPDAPYMIEHGLFEEDASFFWLFKNQKKGMMSMTDLKRCETDWQCELGKKQALPVDFEHSGYRMAPLIWPELISGDLDAKISTFALTNIAPMHPSLYPSWRNAIKEIRRYAIEHCEIPPSNQPTNHATTASTLHIASGVVASNDPEETIGNDINVPYLFWMAGCCVRDKDVKSFAIYARNIAETRVISSSVLQLETLLQDIYRVKPSRIGPKIFPGNDGACGYMKFDDSDNLIL